jgi:hypothetical protein
VALNDDATLVISTGHFYTAPVNSAMPDIDTAITTPWAEVGHTSLDNVIGISSDGGDATVIGTLQNKALRTTYSTRTETLGIVLQQFDTAGLKLYYGSNATVGAAGEIQVPVNPTPTTVAFLAVFEDGDKKFAIYAPKAEIFRSDDIDMSSTEALAGLPLGIKPMVSGTNDWTYAVTPLGTA